MNFTITPEKWINGGFTIGHIDGKTVFLTGGVPGEPTTCVVEKETSKLIYARSTNAHRENVDCQAFPECGGCNYRHIPYTEEIRIKIEELKNCFRNIPIPNIEIYSDSPIGYRNNVQWQRQGQAIGFHARFSHKVVDLRTFGCPNLDDRLRIPKPKHGLELRLSEDGIVDYSRKTTVFRWKDAQFQIPPKGFLQVNKFLTGKWLDTIRTWIQVWKDLECSPDETLDCLELFCGMGLIGQSLMGVVDRLEGWEGSRDSIQAAIANAKTNARSNGIRETHYKTVDLYKQFPTPQFSSSRLWIANPPRSGLGRIVSQGVQSYKPKAILYSSCDVHTMARDLTAILPMGYRIGSMGFFDFFPRTKHFETLCLVTRDSE